MTIKNRIKILLTEKNISQTCLAERLNLSKSTLNNIISGKQNATLETALDIAEILKEPVEQIFYKEKLVVRIERVNVEEIREEFKKLLNKMEEAHNNLYKENFISEETLRLMYVDMIYAFIDKYGDGFLTYIDDIPQLADLEGAKRIIYSSIFKVCNSNSVM